MRVFLYYVGHSFVNSIKKLFRTWIAFLLVVMLASGLVGGLIGFVSSRMIDAQKVVEVMSETNEETETDEQVDEQDDDVLDSALSRLAAELFEKYGIDSKGLVEFAISAFFLFMFFLTLFGSKGIGEIFLPADVTMLFSAPIKPQSIMMFRLVLNLGMQLFMAVFMIFQIPNLIINFHMPVYAAWTMLINWAVLILFTTLIQIIVYLFASKSEQIKKNLKFVFGGLLGIVAAVYVYFVIANNGDMLKAAIKMLTGKESRWVPFWGWMRGLTIEAFNGNNGTSYIYLALMVLGIIALVVVIWSQNVDFYEDAMVATERRAEIMEKAKNSKTGVVRSKDRSDKIKRDGFDKGFGANVFFYKTLYNRKRLSIGGFLTKTMLFYIGCVVLMIVLGKVSAFEQGFLGVCGTMLMVTFYRTLGNPLQEDVMKEFFVMIPASAKSKLFYSLLGGMVSSVMDMIVPYVFAVVWFSPSIVDAVLWFIFILTVGIYGTIVGTFIMVSVSVSLPEKVQQMVQILFIYFGMLPAILFVIIGILTKLMYVFMPIGILGNLLISFLFFMITPHFLENGRK